LKLFIWQNEKQEKIYSIEGRNKSR